MRRLSILLSIFILGIVPVESFALPIQEKDATFGTVGAVKIKVFDQGVSDPAEDPRFASITPAANDFTYFIELVNNSFFDDIQSLIVFKPDTVNISGAGIVSGGDAQVFPTSIFFDFPALGGAVPPCDFFLDPLCTTSTLNLFITSPSGPGEVGALLQHSNPFGGSGLIGATIVGPVTAPPSAVAATPEPGTLFLLGSGLLGLAGLSRKRLTKQKVND